MAQTPNPTQGFNDWLAYQQSMMEKMTAVMTEATPKSPSGIDLQNPAKALTDAWTVQTQRAQDAIAQMTKAWTDATGGAAPGTPAWPAMPNLMDPALPAQVRDKLEAMLAQFGVNLQKMPDMAAGAGAMPSVADALLGRMTRAPAFAHLWDMDRKLVALMASWSKLHTANLAYRTLVAKAWTELQQAAFQKAAKTAMAGTLSSAGKGPAELKLPTPANWSENLDGWLAELSTALTELMRTPDYAKSQKELVAAGNEVRDQLHKLGEEMAPWFQAPGRDEVDELAKSVTQMRKQLRVLAQDEAVEDAPPTRTAAPSAAKGRKR